MSRFLPTRFAVWFLVVFGTLPGWAQSKPSNLIYAQRHGKSLGLDLYYPDSPPPARGYPLIISFHGGGWIFGTKRNDLFLKPLVERGYALASVDYRLSGEAKFPAQIEDAREAVHWLLQHARDLKLDPTRFVTTGISAGGHLALLLAFSESHRFSPGGSLPLPLGTIKAVCAFYPPTDLVSIIPEGKLTQRTNLVARLLGGSVSEKLESAREGSPVNFVTSHSAPAYLVHGDKDRIVPVAQSYELLAALKKAGVKTSFILYEGRGHAFRPTPSTVNDIGDFFDRILRRN